jgi:hypothetical protein
MNWLQRLLQPQQGQNMLAQPQAQAAIPMMDQPMDLASMRVAQAAGTPNPNMAPMPGGMSAPQDQAQQPGLMDRFKQFRDGDGGKHLADIFAGWAMGATPSQSLGMGAAFAREGRNMREGKAEEKNRLNQTVEYLKGQGLDPDSAALVASNPQTLQEFLKQRLMPAEGQEPTDTMRNLEFRAAQAGIQPGTPEYQQFMLSGGANDGGNGEFRQATPEEAAGYGATAGQFGPDGRFYPNNPPSGMSIESDGQGGFRMMQGPGAQNKPFTEGQSKDNVFSTRARGALPTLNQFEQQLTSLGNRALDMDPTGLARGALQNSDFQVAKSAGDEFLQAVLRKDTGAAITTQEQELYGKTYLPQPGDGPEVIQYKRQARERAVAAIEAGMSPAQMVAQEQALMKSGGNAPMAPANDKPLSEMTDEELEAIINGR